MPSAAASIWKGLSPPVLLVAGLGLGAFILWRLSSVVLLLFAAIVIGTVLSTFATAAEKRLRLPRRFALSLATILLLALVSGFIFLMGTEIRIQLGQLGVQLPATLRAIGREFGFPDLDVRVLALMQGFVQSDSTLGSLASSAGAALTVLTTTLLVLIAGTYLAANPGLYRDGLLHLVPRAWRREVSCTMDEIGLALHHWLTGQLITALYIAVVTGVVLWLLGVPAALTLGLIAGLMEFVPYIGALAAAVPAMILAFSTGQPFLPVWVGLAYLVIQQFEGNVLSPIVFQWAVKLPPVVGLFALIAFGVLFGPLGVLLATPLAVTLLVIARHVVLPAAAAAAGRVRQPAKA